MTWSEWQYRGLPELGDLVIAETYHQDTEERWLQKGIVAEISDEGIVRFLGDPPIVSGDDKWIVERWKKWLPSEFKGVSRELELEVS